MDTNTPKNNSDMGIVFNTPNTKEPAQKDMHALSTASTPKDSHLSSRGGVFDVSKVFEGEQGGEAGIIINDRKHRRASFGENMQAVFSEWWGSASKKIEKSVEAMPKLTKEEPTLAKAETRAEIVQEAAKYSTIAPQDDHKVVLEKFHTFKSDVARITGTPTVVLKEPPKKKGILSAWTHIVDSPKDVPVAKPVPVKEKEALDMRHAIAPVVAQKIQNDIKHFTPGTHIPPKQIEKVPLQATPEKKVSMPTPNILPKNPVVVSHDVTSYAKPIPNFEKTSAFKKSDFSPLSKAAPVVPKAVPPVALSPTWLSAREVKEETSESDIVVGHMSIPQPVEQIRTALKPPLTPQRSTVSAIGLSTDPHTFPEDRIQNINTKRSASQVQKTSSVPRTAVTMTTWLIFGGIVALGVILALVVSIYVNVFKGESDSIYAVSSFFTTSEVIGVPLAGDGSGFATAFALRAQDSTNESVQIYPVVQKGEVTRPASSQEFFTALRMDVSRAFLSSLDDAFMMGVVTAKKPEPFLIIRSYNFDELFAGLLAWEGSMQKDLAPLFGTSSGEMGVFIDAVANNKSTRILKSDTGEEVLVYSFINKNTVIITTNGDALAILLSKF
ncbi:hypothetical protein IPH92_04050 [Candidatus Kaiserbacteria bacterium]|nr:MAG: hypothetical protein IPH92_04050 [Candidatus Kaiserbacteria bacterium]